MGGQRYIGVAERRARLAPRRRTGRRPSSVLIGARDERQLRQNLGAVGWSLTPEQVAKLDAVSHRPAPYPCFPYERQEGFARLNPPVFAAPGRAA